jgi:hypothetical protein
VAPLEKIGVYGYSAGTSGTVAGVVGSLTGNSPGTTAGVYGDGNTSDGVYGTSSGGYAGRFKAPGTGTAGTNAALYGDASGSGGTGVLGTGYGYGVYGLSSSGWGVYGASGAGGNFAGVYGTSSSSSSGNGVVGSVSNSYSGVAGLNGGTGPGIYGQSSSGYAGLFAGNVNITTGSSYYYAGSCFGGSCLVSDQRLKKNIAPLTGALDKILEIKGVTFEWKDPGDHGNHTGRQTGVIAQNVEEVFPDWVSNNPDGMKAINVDQRTMIGVTAEAFREQQAEIAELKKRLEALEANRRRSPSSTSTIPG